MHFKIIVSAICFIFASFCRSAPLDNRVPTSSKIMKYFLVVQKYKNFLYSPMPHEVVVSTRSFITQNVQRVDPVGVVLRQCNKTVGPEFDKRWCHHKNTAKVNLEVKVWNPHPKVITIIAEEHTECTCYKR